MSASERSERCSPGVQADAPLPGGGGSLAVDPEEHYGASGAGPSSGGCEAPLVGARRGPPTPAPAPAPAPYSGAGPNIVVAGPMPGEEFEKMTLPIPAPEPNPMEGTHIDQEPPDPAKHRQQWGNIFRAISAKGFEQFFRAKKVRSHRNIEDVKNNITDDMDIIDHHCNAGADALATAAAAVHAIPRHVRLLALKQVRVARILHLTIARVLEARARARPLPGRCAGYTEAELRALHDEVRVEDHPLTRTAGSWAWDEDQGLWADQAEATVVHAADVEASLV